MGCVSRLYVRELREVCGVEVQPPRQPLHQLRALVGAEGPGRGGETGRSHVFVVELQMRSVQPFTHQKPVFQEDAGTVRTHKWVIALRRRLCLPCMYTHTHARKHKLTRGAVPREKGSAASSGLVNHLLFFPAMRQTIRCKWNLHEV